MNRTIISVLVNIASLAAVGALLWFRYGTAHVTDMQQSSSVLPTLLLSMVIGFNGGLLSTLFMRGDE